MQPDEKVWTAGSLLAHVVGILESTGIEDARRNAEWMLEDVLQCRRVDLYAYPERPVSPEAAAQAMHMAKRRTAREPLQHILGHAEFYGLRLEVSPDVLIPRPETEQVVEHALSLIRGRPEPHILDIGTGSGCIALALRRERPDAQISACDVSTRALSVARRNADRLGLPVTFYPCDIRSDEAIDLLPRNLDLVISNPPYVPDAEAATLEPEVARHEPHEALFSGEDPLFFYRRIVSLAPRLLRRDGYLVFEGHASYAAQAGQLMAGGGFHDVQVLPDLAGLPRIISGRYERLS